MNRLLVFLICLVSASYFYAQTPVAQFSVSSTTVCAGSPITFTDLSNYFGRAVISTNWDFGEGGQSNAANPTYTYVNAGTYQVLLTVISTGGTDFEVKLGYITVNPNPTANFTTAGNGCTVPFAVTFGNTSSSGPGINYSWDFGNGATSLSQNPAAVTYNAAGTFPVQLTVTNTSTSCTSSITKNLVVSNFQAGITLPLMACAGTPLTINDASTVGANSWSWTTSDGQSSTLQNPVFTFPAAGNITVNLTSQNTVSGCSDATSTTLTVNPTPIPTFTANPQAGCAPLNVSFSNTSGAGTFLWDFGNGTTSNVRNPPVKTYNANGLYTVSLTMTDANGCVGNVTNSGMITVGPPIASFISDQTNGCAPLSIQFTDQSTSPNPLADPIVSWLWNFGDGSNFNGQNPPPHVYGIGTYNVSLTVTTSTGCTVTNTINQAIEVGLIDLVDFSLFPINECAKRDIQFTDLSVINTPHAANEVTYEWDFGDNGTSTQKDPMYNYPIDTGAFDIQLIVTFRGCSDTLERLNQIYIKAPISQFSAPTLYCNPVSFPVVVNVTDDAIAGKITDNVDIVYRWGDGSPDDLLNSLNVFDLDKGNITHSYNTYGTYVIKQVVHNYTTGCEDSTEQTIYITSMDANFTMSNDTICRALPVTLTSNSVFLDPLATYSYDMGNGDFVNTDPATYSYITPGSYDIKLIATNAVGCSDSMKIPGIKILDPPLANLVSDKSTGCLPITATYTNTSSIQGNGVPLSSFLWTFPDGTTQTTNNLVTKPHFDFTTEGIFTTTIVATDQFGCVSDPNFAFMFITNPTVDFTMPAVVCDVQNFTAVNNSVGFGNLNYTWNIDNVFATTNSNYTNTFDETTSNLYTHIDHSIELIATDGNGCKDSLTKTLTVSLPMAKIMNVASGATANGAGEYTCPPVFETITDQSTSYGTITNWQWSFGDGKTSTFQNPNNTYIFPGTYTLSLSITNQYGCTADTSLIDYLTILGPGGTLNWASVGDQCLHNFQFDATNLTFVDSIVWHLDDGDTIYNSHSFIHKYPIGTFNPTSSLIDSLGCKVTYPMNTLVVPTISISANAGPDQAFCGSSTNLAGNADPNGTGTWTLLSGVGTIVSPNSANTSVTGIGVGISEYIWTIANACDTISDTMSITITDVATVASVDPDQHICVNNSSITGNTPIIGVGNWTLVSGTGTITTPSDPTTTVTNLGFGVNKFVWTIANVCSSTTDTLTITVETLPTLPLAGVDQTICPDNTNLTANLPLSGTGTWTLFNGAGNITNPNLFNSATTGLTVGTNTFVWTIANSCGTNSDTVIIIRETTPTIAIADPDQIICSVNANINANTPIIGTGIWTLNSGVGTITTPLNPSTSITGLAPGKNEFIWTISNTCATTKDTIAITLETAPTLPLAGLDQTLCPSNTILAGNPVLVGNGSWTLATGVGTITNPILENTGITGLGIGINKFVWTISNTCATNSDTVSIIRETPATIASAGPDQTICLSTATLAGNVALSGTGTWTLSSGTGVITSINNPATTITGLTVGVNKFVWTITNSCSSSNDTIAITVEAPPTLPDAGIDQMACIPNAVLNGNTALIGNGIWTLKSGAGLITVPTLFNSGVTGIPLGANVFTWTISNTCGSNSSDVTITGVDAPTTSDAGPDQFTCQTNATLHGNKTIIGVGTWTLISGTGIITNTSDSLSTVTGLSIGPNVFEWNIVSFCGSSSDRVTITVETQPTVSNAGSSISLCANNAVLAGNQALVGTGTWTNGNLGGGTIASINSETSAVTNLSVGPNEFVWTISNSCNTTSTAIIITRVIAPTPANAGNDSTFCSPNGKLHGNNALIGTGRWTVIAGTGTITDVTDSLSNVTGMSIGVNTFRWTISNICDPSNNFDDVTFIIEDVPITPEAGPDQNPLCQTNSTLLAATPVIIGTGEWSVSQGNASITSPNLPNSAVTNLGFGVTVLKWTVSNTCGAKFDIVSITRFDDPTLADVTPVPSVCIHNSTLTGNIPLVGSGLWSVQKGTGTITNTSDPVSTVSNLGVGDNIFRWTIFNGCGTSFKDLKVTVDTQPTLAEVGADQETCGETAILDGRAPKSGHGLWTFLSGTGIVNDPKDSTSGVSNLEIGESVFRWTVSNSCGSSFADMKITNTGLCPDEDSLKNQLIYYVPNVFTPNEEDEHNPVFQPVFTSGYEPLEFTLYIFDRWGEIIFESHDAGVGWKGTYGSDGRKVEDGVYTWKIIFTDINTQKKETIFGHVVLIR